MKKSDTLGASAGAAVPSLVALEVDCGGAELDDDDDEEVSVDDSVLEDVALASEVGMAASADQVLEDEGMSVAAARLSTGAGDWSPETGNLAAMT